MMEFIKNVGIATLLVCAILAILVIVLGILFVFGWIGETYGAGHFAAALLSTVILTVAAIITYGD